MKVELSNEDKQRICELFDCSDDKRPYFISYVLDIDLLLVERTIQEFTDKKIIYERGNFYVLNSSINYRHRLQ